MIQLGESVTWRAKHFGIYQELQVVVTDFDRPHLFADKMIRGAFSSMNHRHLFRKEGNGTLMSDRFEFKAPLGIVGRFAEVIFLKTYMTRFLKTRNAELKAVAESELWREVLMSRPKIG